MLEVADQIYEAFKTELEINGKIHKVYHDGWAHIIVGRKSFFYSSDLRCKALVLMELVPWLEANF